MIRRVIEYVITCDSYDCYESTAFGSYSALECTAAAQQAGWKPKYPGKQAKNVH